MLLIVAVLLHGGYIPLAEGWGYWVSAILIVISVSLFTSAAVSALKPQLFSRNARDQEALDEKHSLREIQAGSRAGLQAREPERGTARVGSASVTEDTTKRLV